MPRKGIKPGNVDDLVRSLVTIYTDTTARDDIGGTMSIHVTAGRTLSSDLDIGTGIDVSVVGPTGDADLGLDRDKDVTTTLAVTIDFLTLTLAGERS